METPVIVDRSHDSNPLRDHLKENSFILTQSTAEQPGQAAANASERETPAGTLENY